MANDVAVESAESGDAKAEVPAPPAEPAPPTIKITDLGGALTACEASQPEGWSACITKELEARGYRVEQPTPEAEAANAGEPAGEAAPAP